MPGSKERTHTLEHTPANTNTHIHTHTSTCIHTHLQTQTNTYTHIHTHTSTCMHRSLCDYWPDWDAVYAEVKAEDTLNGMLTNTSEATARMSSRMLDVCR